MCGVGGDYLYGTPLTVLNWKNGLHSPGHNFLTCEMEIKEYLHFRITVKINTRLLDISATDSAL